MLRTEALSLSYDDVSVIRDLDLELPGGRVTAIIGPNGCGKSTLLRALARLMPPGSGRVTLNGEDINRIPPKRLARQLAILPQTLRAPEGIRVSDLVMRGRIPWRTFLSPWNEADKTACETALEAVGMTGLADRELSELSGGQRQRAWLSLVLAQQTPCLLLDEPTTYLDLTHQMDVLALLRRQNRQSGQTIISVLHDLNLAARYSDNLVLLANGRVVASGASEQVLTPDNLLTAFDLEARVIPDPVTGTPMVVPLEPAEPVLSAGM
ncbi:ABC transporter ATP-binding protein [Roseovarius sp. MMSF_3281]|uniref:ABC transporter ATP-binding protein n=1 Tax=Roseovarius sp. MMSF_3281 TaxID=3046694 RepID=UPI00273FD65C|nr:ABC transporter ATP-binding protein [Roseovarius sp. MMSF_3281]